MKKAGPNSKSKKGELLSRKEQRAKNQKKTHKLTKEQVAMIRSKKGQMSLREICAWFKEQTDNRCTVSVSTVSRILNNKVHTNTQRLSIFDLIEKAQKSDEDINEAHLADVKWTTKS